MFGTFKRVLILLSIFAWGISAQQTPTIVPGNSPDLIISQNGVVLSEAYLSTVNYAGFFPNYCGGTMLLNSTVDSTATLIFEGSSVEMVYVYTALGGSAEIYIDGVYATSINSFEAENVCDTGKVGTTGLPPGIHNLTVVNVDFLTVTGLLYIAYE
ncbi:hypothetical protein FRB93_003527 [Tulasnella sp. JGI-2019a]|nr:hypothetical protein FRB93_003527 [Tulasnella sp. JGI-2019a]